MRSAVFIIAALTAASAMAQEAPSLPPMTQQYVPWQVDQQNDTALRNTLGDIPLKYSLPLLQWLNQREEAAVQIDRRHQVEQMNEKMKAAKARPPSPPSPTGKPTP